MPLVGLSVGVATVPGLLYCCELIVLGAGRFILVSSVLLGHGTLLETRCRGTIMCCHVMLCTFAGSLGELACHDCWLKGSAVPPVGAQMLNAQRLLLILCFLSSVFGARQEGLVCWAYTAGALCVGHTQLALCMLGMYS